MAVTRSSSGGFCDTLCTSGLTDDVTFTYNGHEMERRRNRDSVESRMDLTPWRIGLLKLTHQLEHLTEGGV